MDLIVSIVLIESILCFISGLLIIYSISKYKQKINRIQKEIEEEKHKLKLLKSKCLLCEKYDICRYPLDKEI